MSRDVALTRSAWLDALADLERAVGLTPEGEDVPGDRATDVTGAPAPWAPPVGLGPMPASLVGRARRLLEAQHAAVLRVERARRSAMQHIGLVRNIESSAEPTGSVYLDVNA